LADPQPALHRLSTRIQTDNCAPVWSQTFQYDQYDNLNQFGNQPWTAPYYAANNHYNLTGTSYDAGGNLTSDATNTYTYNASNKLASVAPVGYTCTNNSTASCFTYDAFGRVVEKQSSSGYSQTLYSPAGKSAGMSGQTLSYAFLPLPGGSFALTSGASTFYYMHSDWLKTIRDASTIPASGSGTIFYDRSFAPYSQMYGNNGTAGTGSQFFTGDTHLSSGLFDTPNRELAQNQGRWLTPDPAHAGWNQYAYVGRSAADGDAEAANLAWEAVYRELQNIAAGYLKHEYNTRRCRLPISFTKFICGCSATTKCK